MWQILVGLSTGMFVMIVFVGVIALCRIAGALDRFLELQDDNHDEFVRSMKGRPYQ